MAGEHGFVINQDDERLSGLPAIGMVGDARHHSAEPRLAPHYNAGIEICLCRSGVYRWNVGGRDVDIKPGELSITRPWERHSGQNNVLGPGRLMWIVLAADGSARALDAPTLTRELGSDAAWVLPTIATVPVSHLGSLADAVDLFDRIADELCRLQPGASSVVRAAYVTLLVLIARRLADVNRAGSVGEAEQVPARVLAVLNDVAATPLDGWTSPRMAEQAGLGLTAFTEWCRRATGRSPRWYLIEQRLAAARGRLAAGATVTDAALDSGFSSSQHFSATFRKLYGETPTDYRRRIDPRSVNS